MAELGLERLLTKLGVPLLQGQAGALTMESKADTRLVMISSLRVKAEFQRSGPQPLAGTSQRFPSKAMVTWIEEGRRQRWVWATGCGTRGSCPPQPAGPLGSLYCPGGTIKSWPFIRPERPTYRMELEP